MGYTGRGITIAIVGQALADSSMWARFRSHFGLPSNAPRVIVVGNGAPVDNGRGDVEESDIDVEWAGAVAPQAAIDFVTSAAGVDRAAEYVVNHDLAPIMSLSYDLCESGLGAGGNQFYSQLWEQAASERITVFVASGDSGAYDCTNTQGNAAATPAVNGMASTPYNFAVGGTALSTAPQFWSSTNSSAFVSALSSVPDMPEAAWNEFDSSNGWVGWASGGGALTIYTKPSRQVCTGVPGDRIRDVPDLFLDADPDGVAYLVYTRDDDTSRCPSTSYGMYAFGGTSCASPAFAAIMALIEQSLEGSRRATQTPSSINSPTPNMMPQTQQTPFSTTSPRAPTALSTPRPTFRDIPAQPAMTESPALVRSMPPTCSWPISIVKASDWAPKTWEAAGNRLAGLACPTPTIPPGFTSTPLAGSILSELLTPASGFGIRQ